MPRCRKILANGKRCKASAMAGSKFCLFHTPGQKMKRRKKLNEPETETKSEARLRIERTAMNQLVGRGSRALGGALAARGAFYASNAALYDVTYRKNPARYNVQGTRYVGESVQKTIEMRRTNGGRDFVATQTRTNPKGMPHHVYMGRKMYSWGRIIPVLGFGYVMYNTFGGSGPEPEPDRKGEGWGPMMAAYAAADVTDYYRGGGTTVRLLTGGSLGAEQIVEMFT